MNRKLLLFLVVLSVTGCALEEMRDEGWSDAGRAFSVEQAKVHTLTVAQRQGRRYGS